MAFQSYEPPTREDGDSYNAKDHTDRPLIVKVVEYREKQVSKFSPEGKPAIILHVVDLTDGQVYRNVLWGGGAVVDGLARYLGGEPLVIRLTWVASQNGGNTYVTVAPGAETDVQLAQSYINAKGDPFVQLATPAAAVAPAAAAQPTWQQPAAVVAPTAPAASPAWTQPAAVTPTAAAAAPPWAQQQSA